MTEHRYWLGFGLGFLFGGVSSPILMLLSAALFAKWGRCGRCGERRSDCYCLGGPR
jgi:hypothetical protein